MTAHPVRAGMFGAVLCGLLASGCAATTPAATPATTTATTATTATTEPGVNAACVRAIATADTIILKMNDSERLMARSNLAAIAGDYTAATDLTGQANEITAGVTAIINGSYGADRAACLAGK